MSSLHESVRELNTMIANHQLLEAFERFYGDEIVMVEAGGQPRVGKQANLEAEHAFVDGLTEFDARLIGSVVDEEHGVAYNEWLLAYRHLAYGEGAVRQVAVQRWSDGHIVHEAFYKL